MSDRKEKDVVEEFIAQQPSEDEDILDVIDIDEDDEREILNPKLASKIERIKKKISLDGKRERKIAVDHKVVEERINEFVKRFDIENRIDAFVNRKIDEFQNDENVERILKHANGEGDPDDLLFDVDLFEEIEDYTKKIIRSALEVEKREHIRSQTDKDILDIIDTHVELTLSDAGIDKLTLVAFHHFLKNLEIRAKEFIEKYNDKLVNYNKQKTATHLYSKEIINLLSNHDQLAAFAMTIISLVSSWLEKYRQKSAKLGKFLNELMLMTSDVIVDKIARYVLLIAIKNSSPIKFRSIFSTYLSLIHRNISSMLSANITNVKLGYFAKMQYLFDDSENQRIFNKHQMLASSILSAVKSKRRKHFKKHYFIHDEIKSFLDVNIFDFYSFADTSCSVLDGYYVYAVYGQYVKNSDNPKANAYVFNEDIVSRRNMPVAKNYLELKVDENLRSLIFTIIEDEKLANQVLSKMRSFISRELNPKIYFNEEGLLKDTDMETIYSEIDLMTKKTAEFLR